MTTNNTLIASMQERNEQTLSDIKHLQQIEQEMYETLAKNIKANSITTEQKQQAINKINEISQMRVNLYANLKDIYTFFQKNVASSRTTLDEQKMAIDIVENELNQSKRRLQLLENETYNKLKMVEINTYYGKSYNAHANLMRTIVFICIPLLILIILINREILPQGLGILLISIIIIIGVIYISKQVIDMMNRDNMNYDEYDWKFDPSNAPVNTSSNVSDPWAQTSDLCVGADCCDGTSTYDSTQNICIPNSQCTTNYSIDTSDLTNSMSTIF